MSHAPLSRFVVRGLDWRYEASALWYTWDYRRIGDGRVVGMLHRLLPPRDLWSDDEDRREQAGRGWQFQTRASGQRVTCPGGAATTRRALEARLRAEGYEVLSAEEVALREECLGPSWYTLFPPPPPPGSPLAPDVALYDLDVMTIRLGYWDPVAHRRQQAWRNP